MKLPSYDRSEVLDWYISLYPEMLVLTNWVQGLNQNTNILVMSLMLKTTWHGFYTKRYFSETDLKTLYLLQCFPYNYLEAVIGPTSKLHLTVLVIEGEPRDVDLAGGHEDAGWDVGALALVCHHHVGRVRPVKCFTCTANNRILISLKGCDKDWELHLRAVRQDTPHS